MTEFLIERHGESLGNYHRIFLGYTDLDLTDKGYEQAAQTAFDLKDTHLDAIVCSPLKRAKHTAEAHLKYHDLPIRVMNEFEEIGSGEWEGLERKRIEELWPGRLEDFFGDRFGAVMPVGGEDVLHAVRRFENGLRRLGEEYPNATVLVACHAGILRAFCCRRMTDDLEQWGKLLPFAANASVTKVTLDGGKFNVVSYPTENAFRL